jgi:hypothetical protein
MASLSASGGNAWTVRTSVLSPQRIARCENALPLENFARISIIALIPDRDGTKPNFMHFGGLNVSDQPTKPLSGRTRAEKTPAAAQIRLDDLIPQKRPEGRPPNGVWCQFAKTLNKANHKHERKIIQAVQERQTRCQDQRPQANQRCSRGALSLKEMTAQQRDMAQRNQAMDAQMSLLAKQAKKQLTRC